MRKRLIITAATLAAGMASAITLTVAQADAHAASGPHTDGSAGYKATGQVTFVEHAITDTVVDLGPTGDSLGDLLAFANPVFNATDTTQVGSDQGSCVRTAVGKSWECSWSTYLKAGAIMVQGPFSDSGGSVLAITGGTGAYAGAQGTMTLRYRNKAGTAFDFIFHLL